MSALVVYESMYGDNQQVARAICRGLREGGVPAEDVEVGVAPTEVGLRENLLVVGCPNHAWSMPRPSTRASARDQADGPLVSEGTGVREWLHSVRLATGLRTAAYDTRVGEPKIVVAMDHASHSVEAALKKRGGARLTPAEHFVVLDAKGPLAPGELDRAQSWGRQLAQLLVT